jgi:hypothetical protein
MTDILNAHGALPRALLLHANLATELRKWPEAVRRWENVAELLPKHRALAHLKCAIAHRAVGNLHSAEAALNEAEKAGLSNKDNLREGTKKPGQGDQRMDIDQARASYDHRDEGRRSGDCGQPDARRAGFRGSRPENGTCAGHGSNTAPR